MDVKLPRDYYRKYDSLCFKLASNFVEYPAIDCKQFIQWVQDNRVLRIEQGTEKYGPITRYGEPYMFGIALRKCKQKVLKYTTAMAVGLQDYEMLFDALNYLMIEYLTRLYSYRPLDEIDVLSIFYQVTVNEADSLSNAVLDILDEYSEFNEYGYLMLASLAIYAELYAIWENSVSG